MSQPPTEAENILSGMARHTYVEQATAITQGRTVSDLSVWEMEAVLAHLKEQGSFLVRCGITPDESWHTTYSRINDVVKMRKKAGDQ